MAMFTVSEKLSISALVSKKQIDLPLETFMFMEDFKGKEIERQNYTYGQDGALQENTVQSNFKKPRS